MSAQLKEQSMSNSPANNTDNSTDMNKTDWRTPTLVIVAGCLIAVIGFGARCLLPAQ